MIEPVGFQSICSGIDAASIAWEPLGWRCVGFSEIDKFARAVLAYRWPHVPLHGDFRELIEAPPVGADVLVGGTPCQAFSLAGLRRSLDDERGNLTLEFVRLANAIDAVRRDDGRAPCIITWENVPGVLSVDDNAFGCFLAAVVGEDTPLVSLGGKWPDAGLVIGPDRAAAWRVFDTQFFGMAQRRPRVFVVGSARDGFDPGSILLEREAGRRRHPPRRETGGHISPPISARARGGGGLGTDFERAGGLIVMASGQANAEVTNDISLTLTLLHEAPIMVIPSADGVAVRTPTPRECERLMGLPDDHTLVPWRGRLAPDGPRYRVIGNSFPPPILRWIGERLQSQVFGVA